MITNGSVTVATDGGVLISIDPAGLQHGTEVLLSVRDGRIRIGHGKAVHADFPMPAEAWAAAAIRATSDITVIEVGANGWSEHNRVRKV